MTPRQQEFVRQYLVDLNATQAAIRAGYSERTASSQGERLLRNAEIQCAIAAAQAARSQRTEVTADRVLEELALLGFSDIGQVLDFSGDQVRLRPANEIGEKARKLLASLKVKRHVEGGGDEAREVEVVEFKLWDKLSALEKIGKHLGMFIDRSEVNHKGRLVIVEEIIDGNPPKDDPAAPGAGGVPQ